MKSSHKILLFVCLVALSPVLGQNVDVRLEGVNGITKPVNTLVLKQPLNLTVDINIKTHNNLLKRYDANPVFSPVLKPNIEVTRFIKYQINSFFASNNISISNQSPYTLNILIDQFEVNYLSGNGWTGSAKIDVTLKEQKQLLYEQSTLGFKKIKDNPQNYQQGANAVVKAFHQAINAVNWPEMLSKIETEKATTAKVSKSQNYNMSAAKHDKEQIPEASDIDQQIPFATKRRENTFAVIIGNEKYDNEISVKYAENDARIFHQYVTQTLGVPEKQAHLVLNATYGKMLGELDWLTNVAKTFGEKATIIFYYAGHGMPDEQNRKPYLLPIDGSASQERTAISTSEIYNTLTQHPTNRVLVFFDACFSGAARDGMLASGRGVRIKPRETYIKGNIVVFSAVSGKETAHPYDEESHGLFSYYLMKKIQETRGKVTLGVLYNFIRQQVNQQSVINGKEQNPKVNVSPDMITEWENLDL